MAKCSMTAAIDPGSDGALTARPMTYMTSLTQILLVNFISILGCAFQCNCNTQVNIKVAGHLSTRFGV